MAFLNYIQSMLNSLDNGSKFIGEKPNKNRYQRQVHEAVICIWKKYSALEQKLLGRKSKDKYLIGKKQYKKCIILKKVDNQGN